MNRALLKALSLVMRALIGGTNWNHVGEVVARLMDVDAPGTVKRELARSELRALGLTLASAVLNLAIEAAVVRRIGRSAP